MVEVSIEINGNLYIYICLKFSMVKYFETLHTTLDVQM